MSSLKSSRTAAHPKGLRQGADARGRTSHPIKALPPRGGVAKPTGLPRKSAGFPKMKIVQTFLLALALAAALPAHAFANCGPAADVDPAAAGASLRAARSATLCLLNAQRRNHGESALRFNRKLGLAGLRHARDMVDNRYFSHDAPSGQDFVQRIMQTDYVPASASW